MVGTFGEKVVFGRVRTTTANSFFISSPKSAFDIESNSFGTSAVVGTVFDAF
jgi:hypothetical protein